MEEQSQAIGIMDEVKKNLKTDKLVFGKEMTYKLLNQGKLAKVMLAKNAPAEVVADFTKFCAMSSVSMVLSDMPSDEIGIFCKRPHSIAVMGLLK
ncbi:MAG: hypothetical protein HGA85_09265 [Nanoarchaeota archaeon]|nr:hypothetical protein [Nanoarchaeota archaeon]